MPVAVLIAAIFALWLPSQALAAAGWSGYRHDAQHTGASPYFGPATPSLRWETTAGAGPAIAPDGTVYLGTDGAIRALYPDGSQKWAYPLSAGSPAVASDGTVYLKSGGSLLALTPAGTKKWQIAIDPIVLGGPTVGSDGTVYVTSMVFQAPIRSAATVPGSVTAQYVADGYAHLYAVNPNGTVKWRALKGELIYPPAVAADGTVYVVSGNYLYAFNRNGTQKWRFGSTSIYSSSPAVGSDGTVYVGGSSIFAVNPNGTRKWQYTPPPGTYIGAGDPSIGPDGTIYFGTMDGQLIALGRNGVKKWAFDAGAAVWCAPAIGFDGVLYVGSRDEHLYALNPNGTKKWEFSTAGSFETAGWVDDTPAIASDGTVYFATMTNHFYALGLESSAPTTITIATNSAHPRIGTQFTLSGLVTPSPDLIGKVIHVDVKKPWKSYWSYSSNRVIYAGPGGAASWQYKYTLTSGNLPGTYYFKAFFEGGAGYERSMSRTVSVYAR